MILNATNYYFRDDKVDELVGGLQSSIRAYFTKKSYKKLYDERKGLLCAQTTIRNYLIGKKWLWWQLWLAIKPQLKAGNFEQFKQELAKKTVYAADHLEDVIKERQEAEKKNTELVKEVDELRSSMAGGANAKQDLIDKIAKTEDQR